MQSNRRLCNILARPGSAPTRKSHISPFPLLHCQHLRVASGTLSSQPFMGLQQSSTPGLQAGRNEANDPKRAYFMEFCGRAQGHLYKQEKSAKQRRYFMSLAMILFSLVSAWIAIALAMLWGVLRIARRHHGQASLEPGKCEKGRKSPGTPALSLR